MLKQRVITGLIIIAVLFTALFILPPIGFGLVLLLLGVLGSVEWAKMSNVFGQFGAVAIPVVVTALTALLYTFSEFAILFNVAGVLIWLLLATTLAGALKREVKTWTTVLVVIGVMPPAIFSMIDLLITDQNGAYWLAAMFVLVGLADSAAYFSGRRFGKTKLAPQISPGKTREGLIGALLAVWVAGLASGVIIWNEDFSMMLIFAIVCVICALFSVVGDLYISLQKRMYGVKDSGTLLPGHGGILDRIDSTLAVAPVFALCVKLLLT